MDVGQIAEGLFPCWCMGLWILYLVWNSDHRDLLQVNRNGLIKFAKLMALVTAFRILYLSLFASDDILMGMRHIGDLVPWQTMFGVFWEDACNALPLVILGRMAQGKKWFIPFYVAIIAMASLVFGMLHSYQGVQAIVVMSLYIPFTMRLGQKYGFGTVMLCHTVYDLITFFTFKTIAGF